MNISEIKKSMKQLEKFFVDQYGEVYLADDLHERLARQICEKNKWDWRSEKGIYSAEDFLLHKKGYVKVSNYGNRCFRYVALSSRFLRNKKTLENAEYISGVFNLKLEIY